MKKKLVSMVLALTIMLVAGSTLAFADTYSSYTDDQVISTSTTYTTQPYYHYENDGNGHVFTWVEYVSVVKVTEKHQVTVTNITYRDNGTQQYNTYTYTYDRTYSYQQ